MKKPAKSDDRPRGSEEDGRQYLVHLEKINSVYYDQIKIADQKAAFIFTFMLAHFAAGLVIYWAWNNTLSVLQQSIIMKRHGVDIELFKNIGKMFRRKPAETK